MSNASQPDEPRADDVLGSIHERLGAERGSFLERTAVRHYGDPADESRAMVSGCAVVDRSWVRAVAVTGEDRARFLHGQVTGEVKDVEPGQGSYGFVCQVKGRILTDYALSVQDDRLWMEMPASRAEAIVTHLERYAILDQVVFAPVAAAHLTLVGPRAGAVLGDTLPESPWHHRSLAVAGTEVVVMRDPRFGEQAVTLQVPSDRAADVLEALVSAGATPAGVIALETARVAGGRARYGIDFDDGNFPKETGLDDEAVSYTKGCYLGQEVIARIHYRGGVNRGVCRLHLSDDVAIGVPGAEAPGLSVDGRDVGRLTSAVRTSDGGSIGLAIVHKRGATVDQVLDVETGGTATVVSSPFVGEAD